MSLKSKIEAVIYASEEPVTLAQLVGALLNEAQVEIDALAALQAELPLSGPEVTVGEDEVPQEATLIAREGELQDSPESNPVAESEGGPASPNGELLDEPTSEPEIVADEKAEPQIAADPEAYPATADPEREKRLARERERNVRDHLRRIIDELVREYAEADRGIEIREVAGGFRMATKPEYHDAVRGFVRSLKPALRLSLQALETLAVVAYKQPATAAEISEIRGVDSAGVLGGLLTRKLIQTAGRKQVIGRPMLYKTSKEFLVRFGLKDIQELPSMEEFERMAGELNEQEDLPMEPAEAVIERANARGDAERLQAESDAAPDGAESPAAAPETGQSASSGPETQSASEPAETAAEGAGA